MIYRKTITEGKTSGVLSIDPGFKTTGFTYVNFETSDIDIWGFNDDTIRVKGVPFPELFFLSKNRVESIEKEITSIPKKGLEVVIEFSPLNLQFSTSLNVLLSAFCLHFIENKLCSKITFVPPKTSHWMLKGRRKVLFSEFKKYCNLTFKDIDKWVGGKKITQHMLDSLMFLTFLYPEFFIAKGIIMPFPENNSKEKEL